MKHYQYGSLRLTLGLLGLLGVAGSADQSPLSSSMITPALASLALGFWGVSRMQNGPTLRLLTRLLGKRRGNHGLIYARAAGRGA